jgi:hypothetical protein
MVTASRSPSRRRPRLFQQVALLAQHAHLTAQLAQLDPLVAAQAVALAGVDLRLLAPTT